MFSNHTSDILSRRSPGPVSDRVKPALSRILFVTCVLIASAGCSVSRAFPAKGELSGNTIAASVDSEIAKYYLEEYLAKRRTMPEFDSIIDQIHRDTARSFPTREYLEQLTRYYSVDFASLYLAKRILEDPRNKKFHRILQEERAKVEKSLDNGTGLRLPAGRIAGYRVLFVPGWNYERTGGQTGGDLAKQRESLSTLGMDQHLIRTNGRGTVEENSAVIAKEILSHSRSGKKIILASISAGGPAVAHAIGARLDAEELQWVKAWINIGGVLRGSLLWDSWKSSLWRSVLIEVIRPWWDGFEGLESMAPEQSRERFAGLEFPRHILVINYAAMPLSGHVAPDHSFHDLSRYGPNDGITLVTDSMVREGITVLSLGLDHLLKNRQTHLETVAMAMAVIRCIESLDCQP